MRDTFVTDDMTGPARSFNINWARGSAKNGYEYECHSQQHTTDHNRTPPSKIPFKHQPENQRRGDRNTKNHPIRICHSNLCKHAVYMYIIRTHPAFCYRNLSLSLKKHRYTILTIRCDVYEPAFYVHIFYVWLKHDHNAIQSPSPALYIHKSRHIHRHRATYVFKHTQNV